jgi:hypothetical protein
VGLKGSIVEAENATDYVGDPGRDADRVDRSEIPRPVRVLVDAQVHTEGLGHRPRRSG